MPKSKPRWESRGLGGFVPPIPEKLRRELADILDADPDTETRFFERLENAWDYYHLYQEARRGHNKYPTPAEKKAAAKTLRKDTLDLAKKLGHTAGGLDAEIHAELLNMGWSRAVDFSFHRLADSLYHLAIACDAILTKPPESLWARVPRNPRKFLAWSVARNFSEVLNEAPSGYCSSDYSNERGKYARVLAALFKHADGREPGDLRKLVQWGKRHSNIE